MEIAFKIQSRKNFLDSHLKHIYQKKDKNDYDLLFVADDGIVRAHKLVMSVASDFCRELLDYPSNEKVTIIVPNYKKCIIEMLVRLCYTGEVALEQKNAEEFASICIDFKLASNLNLHEMYDHLNLKKANTARKSVEEDCAVIDFEELDQDNHSEEFDQETEDEDVHTENVFVTDGGFKPDHAEAEAHEDGGFHLRTEAIIQEDERYQQAIIDVITNGLSIVASASEYSFIQNLHIKQFITLFSKTRTSKIKSTSTSAEIKTRWTRRNSSQAKS